MSATAWNCRSFSYFSLVSRTRTGFFSTDSSRARKYRGSYIGKVGVHWRHFTDSFPIAGNTLKIIIKSDWRCLFSWRVGNQFTTVRTENFQMHYILYLSGLEIISVINLKISTVNEICRLKYDKLVSFYIWVKWANSLYIRLEFRFFMNRLKLSLSNVVNCLQKPRSISPAIWVLMSSK